MAGYEESVRYFASVDVPDEKISSQVDSLLKCHMKLLKPFYFDRLLLSIGFTSKEQDKRLEVICLELLGYLVAQQFGEFYCLLERLTPNERLHKFVKYVTQVEESLMEGNYSQLLKLNSSKDGFSPLFKRSVEKLGDTVQKEVAQCIEQAYTQISQKDAMAMLKTDSKKQKSQLPAHWQVTSGQIYFDSKLESLKRNPKIEEKTSKQLIKETLGFAKELERIV